MHSICTLYAPYIHTVWRTYLARARARARAPGPRRRGASGPYPQRELKYFHTRARAGKWVSFPVSFQSLFAIVAVVLHQKC